MVDQVRRNIQLLTDESQNIRKQALETLMETYTVEYSEELIKPVLKRLSDDKEKCRELAYRLLQKIICTYHDTTLILPYLFPVLVKRLDAYDFEGIEHLPENIRPNPSTSPMVLKNPIEKSEEIRLRIAEVVNDVISVTKIDHLLPHLDEVISVIRAICMDPESGDVRIAGCKTISLLVEIGKEYLLHYGEPISRSLFACLVHKHAKVRIAGLEAIYKCLQTTTWKFSHQIMENLSGVRDPNSVPIKDFYEPSYKHNYLATLCGDRSTAVRETYYRTLGDCLTLLQDRIDLEPRIMPYLLSGLFDNLPDIQSLTFEYLEEVGEIYETDKETEIREIRQFGYQDPWTCDGKLTNLPLPPPFVKRPRMGTRLFVRQYIRRYLKPIFKELTDWISDSQLRSSNLLLSLIIFTEDFMTQHIDTFTNSMFISFGRANKEVLGTLSMSCKLVGRFVLVKSWLPNVLAAIRGELGEVSETNVLPVLSFLISGAMEAQVPGDGIHKVEEHLDEILTTLLEADQWNDMHQLLEAFLKPMADYPGYFGDLIPVVIYKTQIAEAIFRSKNGIKENYERLIKILQYEDERKEGRSVWELQEELIERLLRSDVSVWHRFDRDWLIFNQLVATAGVTTPAIVQIMEKVVRSRGAASIQLPCFALVPLMPQLPYAVVIPALRNAALRESALELLQKEDSLTTNPELLAGMRKALLDERPEIRTAALEVMHAVVEDLGAEEPTALNNLMYKSYLIIPTITLRLSELLDDTSEPIRVASAVVLQKFCTLEAKYQAVFHDASALIQKLVGICLSEDLNELKIACQACLIAIHKQNKILIQAETVAAQDSGQLRRSDFLTKICVRRD